MANFENVARAFSGFNSAIKVDPQTLADVNFRLGKMETALDNYYYGSNQKNKVFKVGSIGRQTDIHASDVDIIYKVPRDIYNRYNAFTTNGQQAMLYAFKEVIRGVYDTSSVKADGLVVALKFSDGIAFELMPAVENTDGSFTYPRSNSGGSWGKTDPMPEISAMDRIHSQTARNARKLARMVRAWKEYNGVSMGGLLIDTYVYQFLQTYEYKDKGYYYYDWLTRDFFEFLSRQKDDVTYTYALGSNQLIYLTRGFAYKAKVAHAHALNAIEAHDKGYNWTSYTHWKAIYGTKFPDFS
jgi:hypothetical protein